MIQTSVRRYSRFDLPRTFRLAMLNLQCGAVPQFALFSFPRPISTGAHMKLSIVFKNVERHNPAEKQLQQCADKLSKLLKNYDPDLVQLHCVFSVLPRTKEFSLALNLVLPTATLHATEKSEHLPAACKSAFTELGTQVKKHLARLRKHYEWNRRRPRAEALA
jgi:ribosome-associated translation inhibitor RaiA